MASYNVVQTLNFETFRKSVTDFVGLDHQWAVRFGSHTNRHTPIAQLIDNYSRLDYFRPNEFGISSQLRRSNKRATNRVEEFDY